MHCFVQVLAETRNIFPKFLVSDLKFKAPVGSVFTLELCSGIREFEAIFIRNSGEHLKSLSRKSLRVKKIGNHYEYGVTRFELERILWWNNENVVEVSQRRVGMMIPIDNWVPDHIESG